MELRLLRSFRQVAADLNFSRSAEKLFVAQPALSRQIQQLEDELGVTLFDRTRRSVRLTAAGTYLNDQLGPWLDTLAHLTKQTKRIHNGELGELCIGHPGSALYSVLPDALAAFTQACPDVISCLREVGELELQEALTLQKIDVGLTREVPDDGAFSTQLILEEPQALVVPGSHWLTTDTFISMAQCRNEPFVLPSPEKDVEYSKLLMRLFTVHGYAPRIMYESNYGATILRLVEKNLGLSVLPISYQFGSSLDVRFIPLPSTTKLHLIWRTANTSPVVARFVQVCQQVATNWAAGSVHILA
ncbi:LysR substrate-binding domain-containing protein [uncultured Fibrella sp.]|uniref:LysR substrate-binding domain-containing protein n=1 Tax=uncultured Fibrella sp. TaxID=1284596 RepID=UPI0035C99742